MVRFGNICDVNTEEVRVRVQFDDDAITSHWLPLLVPGTKGDKYFRALEINSHVACLMDENLEDGVCLGAIYDANNKPGFGNAKTTQITFSDGAVVKYDAETSTMEVEVGTVTFKASETGFEISRGGESIKTILSDFLTGITALTVTCAAPGSPSTPPVNLATFTALITRLNNLFTA